MFIRLRQLLRRGRGQEGAAAVEFAIILPLLILILAGFIDFGWGFYWKHTVTNASRAGARYAIQADYPFTGNPPVGVRTPHTLDQITLVVQKYGTDLAVEVVGNTNSGAPRSVTVTKTMQWFFFGFLSTWEVILPTEISNTTTMTME